MGDGVLLPAEATMSRSGDLLAAVQQLRAEGYLQSAIAATLGISRGSVSDYLTGRYEPGERIAERSFDFVRYEQSEEDNKRFGNGVEHRVMWLPRSFSPESDLAYWRSQNPGAKGYFIRWGDGSGGYTQTTVERKPVNAVQDALSKNARYRRKQKPPQQLEDGVEFVAVFHHG